MAATDKNSGNVVNHAGSCFCGEVKIEVTGAPEAMGHCHCRSCQSWSGGPVNAFSLWKPESVRVVAGDDHLSTFQKTGIAQGKFCSACGGHVMANHPGFGVLDVFAATIPTLAFQPGLHINYAQTVLPVPDGLPKFLDFPTEFGGTGETAAEAAT